MFAAEFELAVIDSPRSEPRAPISLDARLGRGGLDRTLCRVVDVSRHGLKLLTYSPLKLGQIIWLTLPTLGPRAAKVIWADDYACGCQFAEPLEEMKVAELLAMTGEPRSAH